MVRTVYVIASGRVGLAPPKKGWWGKPHPIHERLPVVKNSFLFVPLFFVFE
jgi:hypothetical protein